jgi:hypothetical protein
MPHFQIYMEVRVSYDIASNMDIGNVKFYKMKFFSSNMAFVERQHRITQNSSKYKFALHDIHLYVLSTKIYVVIATP